MRLSRQGSSQLTSLLCGYQTPFPELCFPRCTWTGELRSDTLLDLDYPRIEVEVKRIKRAIPMITSDNHRRNSIPSVIILIEGIAIQPPWLRISIDAFLRRQEDAGVSVLVETVQVAEGYRRGKVLHGCPVDHGRGMNELLGNIGRSIGILAMEPDERC